MVIIVTVMHNLINYSQLISEKHRSIKYPVIFLARHKRNFLIGPIIKNKDDLLNFKYRFISSSIIDFKDFYDVIRLNKNIKRLIDKQKLELNNICNEVDIKGISLEKHYILQVLNNYE